MMQVWFPAKRTDGNPAAQFHTDTQPAFFYFSVGGDGGHGLKKMDRARIRTRNLLIYSQVLSQLSYRQ